MSFAARIRNWPLRRKLPFIVVSASASALLLACVALLSFDALATRRASARDLDSLAELMSQQTAVSLIFPDRPGAARLLASLRTSPDIESAALYDADAKLFAGYVRENGRPPSAVPPSDGVRGDGGRIVAAHPILQETARIGTITLTSTLGAARARLQLGVGVAAAVLALSSLVALGLALRLGRMIVHPVASLAGAMEEVSRSRRYDTRVEPQTGDEIGHLVKDFNAMLGAIQERDAALARTASIIEATVDFVGVADPEGRVLYLNGAARRMIDLGDAEDAAALRISDCHPPDVAIRIRQEGVPAAIREGVWRGETALLSRTGRVIPVSQVIVAHKGPDGRLLYVSTIIRDVSDVRAAQDALRHSEERLQMAQRMEALGRLAGGVAHDFNNLLTVMGGHAQLMSLRLRPGDPLAEHPETIAKAVDRAGALTAQLLAFSRRQVIQPRILDLNAVVREGEKMLRRLIGENIRFDVRLAEGLPCVRADQGQLDQVLMNLAVNARDAMPSGGRLGVSTGTASLDAAEAASLGLAQPGAYVTLTVEDDGAGMDADTMSHLFEPFFTTKEKGKGTGLGLATVYGIARQSGGSITARSTLGAGTSFQLLLPGVAEAADRRSSPAPAAPSRGAETILVVEDEDAVRAVIRSSLVIMGYTVLETSGADEALEVLDTHRGPIDLVVSDVVMPGLSGPVLALKILAERPGVRILFISGYPEDELGPRGELERSFGFLRKPFSPADLAAKVRESLDRPPAGADREATRREVPP